jgi:hypothetical protein
MTEYTSLDVSRRLADAGFEGEPSAWWQRWPDETVGWSIGSYDTYATVHICSYRADTLMEWLVARGWDISIGKPHDKVLVDAASMKLNQRIPTDADTIPDALGEVILAVLAKEAEHGND